MIKLLFLIARISCQYFQNKLIYRPVTLKNMLGFPWIDACQNLEMKPSLFQFEMLDFIKLFFVGPCSSNWNLMIWISTSTTSVGFYQLMFLLSIYIVHALSHCWKLLLTIQGCWELLPRRTGLEWLLWGTGMSFLSGSHKDWRVQSQQWNPKELTCYRYAKKLKC